MASEQGISPQTPDRAWYIVGRWQEYEGEGRANLLRIIAIGAFYVVEMVSYEVYQAVDRAFHQQVTVLAVAWTMVALGILLCLRRRIFPASLKYVSTGCDVVLLTCVLIVADGPRSPLVIGYLLIISIATLRFKLRLVWYATLGSMAGYAVLLGYAKWYAPADRDLTIPRYEQLIVLVALALSGIVVGQVIRRVKGLAEDYARRTSPTGEPKS